MVHFYVQAIAKTVGGGTRIIPTAGLPSPQDVDKLANRVGVRFPDDYVQFLLACGSLLVQVDEEIWPRPEIGSVGPHWMQTMFELSVFGVCTEVDWMRIEVEAKQFQDERGTKLVPVFAFANTSDRICFDAKGKLVAWSKSDDPQALDESFEEVLMRLLLEQREYKEQLSAPPAKPARPAKPAKKPPARRTPGSR